MTCDHEAQIRDLLEEREELRRSRDEAWAAYREAIGVPPSEHQRERLERMALAREASLEEAAELLAEVRRLESQVAGLEQMNTEKAAVIRRLRMGNHPAGRALVSRASDLQRARALAEALTERDAEHEGGGGA